VADIYLLQYGTVFFVTRITILLRRTDYSYKKNLWVFASCEKNPYYSVKILQTEMNPFPMITLSNGQRFKVAKTSILKNNYLLQIL